MSQAYPPIVSSESTWLGILLLVLMGLGVVWLIRSALCGRHNAGWMLVVLAFLVGGIVFVRWIGFSNTRLAVRHQQAMQIQSKTVPNEKLWDRLAQPSRTQPQVAIEAVREQLEASNRRKRVEVIKNIKKRMEAASKRLASSVTSVDSDKSVAAAESEQESSKETSDKKDRKQDAKIHPDWIDNPPKRVGNVYRRVVFSDPFLTVDECHKDLETKLSQAVASRIEQLVGQERSGTAVVAPLEAMGLGLDFVLRDICDKEYVETVDTSVGEMKKVHVLMEFTPAVERELRQAWQSYQRRHRLTTVVEWAASILAGLAFVYGLLKVDTWTRGYYTGRLLLGASAAIILFVAILVS